LLTLNYFTSLEPCTATYLGLDKFFGIKSAFCLSCINKSAVGRWVSYLYRYQLYSCELQFPEHHLPVLFDFLPGILISLVIIKCFVDFIAPASSMPDNLAFTSEVGVFTVSGTVNPGPLFDRLLQAG